MAFVGLRRQQTGPIHTHFTGRKPELSPCKLRRWGAPSASFVLEVRSARAFTPGGRAFARPNFPTRKADPMVGPSRRFYSVPSPAALLRTFRSLRQREGLASFFATTTPATVA